jgi:hypothetical protein
LALVEGIDDPDRLGADADVALRISDGNFVRNLDLACDPASVCFSAKAAVVFIDQPNNLKLL